MPGDPLGPGTALRARALLALPLLPVALLAGLPLLAAGVGELTSRILQTGGRGREVTVHLDPGAGAGQGLAQPVERGLGARAVTLREAGDRVAKRLTRGPVRLVGLSLELGELPRQLVALGLSSFHRPCRRDP